MNAPLTWKPDQIGLTAMRGEQFVGHVIERDDGLFYWQITAVHTKWICQGYGELKTERGAKRALESAWGSWLAAFSLTGSPS